MKKKGRTRLYCVEDCAELRSRIDRELAQIEGVEVLGYAGRASEAVREIRKHQPGCGCARLAATRRQRARCRQGIAARGLAADRNGSDEPLRPYLQGTLPEGRREIFL